MCVCVCVIDHINHIDMPHHRFRKAPSLMTTCYDRCCVLFGLTRFSLELMSIPALCCWRAPRTSTVVVFVLFSHKCEACMCMYCRKAPSLHDLQQVFFVHIVVGLTRGPHVQRSSPMLSPTDTWTVRGKAGVVLGRNSATPPVCTPCTVQLAVQVCLALAHFWTERHLAVLDMRWFLGHPSMSPFGRSGQAALLGPVPRSRTSGSPSW